MISKLQNRFYDKRKKELLHAESYTTSAWKSNGKSADALVDCGCNAVAYYVPWFVHEYEEGKFDFTGEFCPENDLHTWIQLKKRACWASLQISPCIVQ